MTALLSRAMVLVMASTFLVSCAGHAPWLWSTSETREWIKQDPGLRISGLGASDRAIVDVDFWGCFSDSHFRLQFIGGSPAQVEVFEVSRNRNRKAGLPEDNLGTVDLTTDDLSRLDGALSVYRAEHPCASSGYTELRISWYRGGRRIDRERLEYSCCGSCDGIDVLHIGEVIQRAQRHDT